LEGKAKDLFFLNKNDFVVLKEFPDRNPADETEILAMSILIEKNYPTEKWDKYIPTFPTEHHNLHLWSDEELSELQIAVAAEIATKQRLSLLDTYEWWNTNVFEKHRDLFPETTFNVKTFIWAIDTVWTRYFHYKHSTALIPFVDFANCNVNLVVEMYESDVDGQIYLKSNIVLDKEFEVCISYGKKTNEEYLLFYGFVMENNLENAIRIKFSNLSMDLTPKTEEDSWKEDAYNAIEFSSRRTDFQIKEVKGLQINDVLSFLKICRIYLADRPLKRPEFAMDSKFELEVIAFARDRLSFLLRSYGTTIEQDRKILASSETYRKQLAIRFRIMEKAVITSSIVLLDSFKLYFGYNSN